MKLKSFYSKQWISNDLISKTECFHVLLVSDNIQPDKSNFKY